MAGTTVLVVEDEPRIVEFLVENLRADDYSVLTAGTAEEAIELLAPVSYTHLTLPTICSV